MEKTKMSPSSWKSSLSRLLGQWTSRQNRPPRIAILGIGNTLRSDDAAGSLIARRLAGSCFPRDLKWVLVMDAGHAPENATAEVRRFEPELILLIDAAQMNEAPGTIRWIGMDEIDGMSASSHTIPLSVLAEYMRLEFNCEVKLLGIQPQFNEVNGSISGAVLLAVDEVTKGLLQLLGGLTRFRSHHVN